MFRLSQIQAVRRVIPTMGRRMIHLQALDTPNENALKFLSSDMKFLPEGLANTVEVDSLADAFEKSPLSERLFKINGVKSIMLGPNFITINKIDNSLSGNKNLDWTHLSPQIKQVIDHSFASKVPTLTETFKDELQKELDEAVDDDDDAVYEIKELINTRIRPALQDDGGDIHFRSFNADSGTVYIKLKGACKECSLSEETLKNGIENMLKHYVPEVECVKAVLDPEEEIALEEFEKFEKRLSERKKV